MRAIFSKTISTTVVERNKPLALPVLWPAPPAFAPARRARDLASSGASKPRAKEAIVRASAELIRRSDHPQSDK